MNTQRGAADSPENQPEPKRETQDEAASLEALSAAGHAFAAANQGGKRRRHSSFTLAVVAGLLVGTATTCSGRFAYRCGSVLRVDGPQAASRTTEFRKDLLDFAWREAGPPSSVNRDLIDWSVDCPDAVHLRYCVIAYDRIGGVEQVRDLTERFLIYVDQQRKTARDTRTVTEQRLAESTQELQERLDQATSAVAKQLADLPTDDPSEDRTQLLADWEARRSSFLDIRDQLARAEARVNSLETAGTPSEGVVDPTARRTALEAASALEQDRQELRVNLTEGKLHMLNVWQASSALLDQLVIDAGQASKVAQPEEKQRVESHSEEIAIAAFSVGFRTALEQFASDWRSGFLAIRDVDVASARNDLIARYDQLSSQLRRFQFKATSLLESMQSALKTLEDAPGNRARHHVRHADLVRAVQRLSTSFHRFRFEAERINPRENFKLDAALRASRGLTRRCQQRTDNIERQLAAVALEKARQQWEENMRQATMDLNRLRTVADEAVTQLFDLQGRINGNSQLAESFLRNSLGAEAAQALAETAQGDLFRTRAITNELRDQRIEATQGAELEIVQCAVLDGPVNLMERLTYGLVAALVTLATTMLGQWWLARRA